MIIDTDPRTHKQERRYLIYDLMAINQVSVTEVYILVDNCSVNSLLTSWLVHPIHPTITNYWNWYWLTLECILEFWIPICSGQPKIDHIVDKVFEFVTEFKYLLLRIPFVSFLVGFGTSSDSWAMGLCENLGPQVARISGSSWTSQILK